MGNDGVAAVHHPAVVPALVEHAQIHAQHAGVVHVAVDGALVGADDHEAVRGGLEVGDVLEHGLHHLVGGHHVVHAHQGHRVGHPGVVGVKGDDVGHPHALQLLQRIGAVQAFPVGAAVLAAAVEQRHDDGDAVGLAAGGLDQPLQVLVVVVGAHAVFRAEQPVLAAVVAHIHHEVEIVAPHGALDHALAVAGGKAGALAGDDEGLLVKALAVGPTDQVAVDQRGQFVGAGGGDEAKVGHTVAVNEKLGAAVLLLHHKKQLLFFFSIPAPASAGPYMMTQPY